MSQLYQIISDSLAIKAQGRRRVSIGKSLWIQLVSDIFPECSNTVLISTDVLGKWMAPTNKSQVKARGDQRKDHEHRDDLPRSGKQKVHMRAVLKVSPWRRALRVRSVTGRALQAGQIFSDDFPTSSDHSRDGFSEFVRDFRSSPNPIIWGAGRCP